MLTKSGCAIRPEAGPSGSLLCLGILPVQDALVLFLAVPTAAQHIVGQLNGLSFCSMLIWGMHASLQAQSASDCDHAKPMLAIILRLSILFVQHALLPLFSYPTGLARQELDGQQNSRCACCSLYIFLFSTFCDTSHGANAKRQGVKIHLCCIGVERRVIVGLAQQGLDGQQHSAHTVGSAPLLLQNIQADVAVLVHIWVEARCFKPHGGRLEWVVCMHAHIQSAATCLLNEAQSNEFGSLLVSDCPKVMFQCWSTFE